MPTAHLDLSSVDPRHAHKDLERTLSSCSIRAGYGSRQDAGAICHETPRLFLPQPHALTGAIDDNRATPAVCLSLIIRRNLKRERLVALEHRAAVQADAGDAHSPDAGEVVARGEMNDHPAPSGNASALNVAESNVALSYQR